MHEVHFYEFNAALSCINMVIIYVLNSAVA